MAVLHEFIVEVDKYLATPKRIVGATSSPLWQEGREIGGDSLEIKLPIEVNGEQHETQKFIVSAFPNADELIFSIGITFQWSVCRLDYDLDRPHSNAGYPISPGIPVIVMGNHYHPWSENRGLIKDISRPFELHVAVPLDVHIRQFDAALRWFCQQNNIELTDHQIELPSRTRLL